MQIVVGIDGGMSGSIAIAKGGDLSVLNMPDTVKGLHDLFGRLRRDTEVVCFLEKVNAFIGEGDEKKYGIIKMIKQVERLKTVLEVLEIQLVEIASVTWQSRLKLNKEKGLSKAQRKKKYYEYAKKWAPRTKFTLRQADSICILACGLKMISDVDPLVTGKDFESLELF